MLLDENVDRVLARTAAAGAGVGGLHGRKNGAAGWFFRGTPPLLEAGS